jgi:lysophospholipase L1-like esterase
MRKPAMKNDNNNNKMSPRKLLPLAILGVIMVSVLVVLLFSQGSSSSSTSSSFPAASRGNLIPQVVLFGDSLTEYSQHPGGFAHDLLAYCARKCDLQVRGLAGYNTTSARRIVRHLVPENSGSNIRLFSIWFGANDAVLPGDSNLHTPIKQYQENLVEIVVYLIEEAKVPESAILLMCPPPVIEAKLRSKSRKLEQTKEYATICEETGKRLKVKILNIFTIFSGMPNLDELLREDDGLHLSAKGNQEMASLLLERLESFNLPKVFPEWKNVKQLDGFLSSLE